jgi:acyl carrier protein
MKEIQDAQSEAMDAKLLAVITQLSDEIQPGHLRHLPLTLDTSLDRDLGFDSLTRVELLSRIEQAFDISIPEQVLASVETPRDFLRAVRSTGGRIKTAISTPAAKKERESSTVSAPAQAETLLQVLRHHAAQQPERTHIRLYSDEEDGEHITYGDLWQSARRIAAGLQDYGLAPGENVLIMLPTGREYFTSFFGILLAGGTPVPLYPPGRMKQIEEHLSRHTAIAANSRAGIMITVPEAKVFAQLMHRRVKTLRAVATVQDLCSSSDAPPALHEPTVGTEDTAFLQYTSGSTGMPKGVVLSHANLLANLRAMGQVIHFTSDDAVVSWLPLYHDMGLIGAWLGSLYFGCPLTVMSPLAFIARPVRWLQAIHRYRATLSAAPNFAYELCLHRIDDKDLQGLDLSSWRYAFNGAEAVSPITIERFTARFGKYGFAPETMTPVYGLAESSVALAFPPKRRRPIIDCINRQMLMDKGKAVMAAAGEHDAARFVSCGQPLPGHQIRIVDDAGRELPDRRQGRLQFSGPSATSGYFRSPDQTRSLFDDQWLNSGDLAYIADGEVYITGRSKDMIIRGGRNIYPTELEEAIGKIKGISKGNVAVFGSMEKDSATERLVVLAETRKRQPEDLAVLRIAVNTVVNDLCGTPPDEVVLAPPNTVLKTSSGKIRRAASRQLYEENKIGKRQPAVWLQITRYSLASVLPQLRRLWQQLTANGYAAYIWMLFGLIAPIVWLLMVLLPVESWRWAATRCILRFTARCAAMRILVKGLDNLPDENRPCILVSNHASYLDSIILAAVLPRSLSFIAKAELQRSWLLRLPLQRMSTAFVDRFNQQQSRMDIRALLDRAQSGRSLLFFAEGTLMRMPGLLPFRLGAFETAVEGNLPIVPIAIRGTRSILRGDSWFPRRGAVSVIIGPVLRAEKPDSDAEPQRWQATLALRDRVRSWILRHCGEPDLQHENPTPLQNKPA